MNTKSFHLIALLLLVTVSLSGQTIGGDFDFVVESPPEAAGEYDYGGTSNFGPDITENFCGELVWGGPAENLSCEPISADLTGKIALIRRGTCDFSLKIWHAQEAGAIAVVIVDHGQGQNAVNEPVDMLGGDMADEVNIPAIILSFLTSEIIVPAVNSGTVEVCFRLPTIQNSFGPYSYSTPRAQIVPLENISVQLINRTGQAMSNVEGRVEIISPLGETTTLIATNDLPVNEVITYHFEHYLPKELGEYTMVYSSDHDVATIERKFEITENTFATDDGIPVGSRGLTNDDFATSDFFQQSGSLVIAGADEMATHITFGLANGEELYTRDENSDIVVVAVYNADQDGNNILDLDIISTFEDLGQPLEIGIYQIDGTEVFDKLVTVELENPVLLEKDRLYYATVAYSGEDAGTGIAPRFSVSKHVDYNNSLITPLQTNGQLFNGWDRSSTMITRLHTKGHVVNTDEYHNSEFSLDLINNPVLNGILNFSVNDLNFVDNAKFCLFNSNGELLKKISIKNNYYQNYMIDVHEFDSGLYFIKASFSSGYICRKFIIQN
ncbi:PA domain-containing protein [Portibacter marinus]|uniref:PA domain-containing protein n=1 Tax=Portibacter marinus TaxID=2898660 RepID=UPI001F26172D|nr:PA domain-containing protein [Portibacter marinus]